MREAILEAAGRCIVARGHAALSTRAVAVEAGVNQSLIHYYFGTKERLTLAVLERMNQALLKRQAEMFQTVGSVADKWAQACRFYETDLRSGQPGGVAGAVVALVVLDDHRSPLAEPREQRVGDLGAVQRVRPEHRPLVLGGLAGLVEK